MRNSGNPDPQVTNQEWSYLFVLKYGIPPYKLSLATVTKVGEASKNIYIYTYLPKIYIYPWTLTWLAAKSPCSNRKMHLHSWWIFQPVILGIHVVDLFSITTRFIILCFLSQGLSFKLSDVSKNGGFSTQSIPLFWWVFHIINHPFWCTTNFWKHLNV